MAWWGVAQEGMVQCATACVLCCKVAPYGGIRFVRIQASDFFTTAKAYEHTTWLGSGQVDWIDGWLDT